MLLIHPVRALRVGFAGSVNLNDAESCIIFSLIK